MSSICGVVGRDGIPVEPAEIGRMIDCLAHWAPDATGSWRDGAAALGHLALWSTPEARLENQPWRLAEAAVVVVADVRIDNREDLIRDMALDRPASLISDVELIARAYLKWGTRCPERLVGDFAFALWDAREHRLFCARDPMGVKPLFYAIDQRRFRFASQIRALFTDPAVPRDFNPRNLAQGLAGLQTFDDETAFAAVHSVEPASAVSLDHTGLRKWKYWRLELDREIRFARDDDYVEAFEEILQRAVDARLRTTGRVGFTLSGGLDVSTALALALRGGKVPSDRVSAFSWVLPEGDDWPVPDEREFIEAFLKEYPVDHHYVLSEAERIFEVPAEVWRHGNGPEWRIDYCQMVPTLAEARRRGVRVLVTGTAGDEISSYAAPDYIPGCLLRGDWSAVREELAIRSAASGRRRTRILLSLLRPYLTPPRAWAPFEYQWKYRRYCDRVGDLAERGIPLPQTLANAIDIVGYIRGAARPRIPGGWRAPVRADQIYTLSRTHVVADQVNAWGYAAAYGIEVRCPYLDRRVIEFSVAVPPNQHRYAMVRRRLLRRVAARHVPAVIARRNDKGVTFPDLARGLVRNESVLARQISDWRRSSAVTRFVDVDRLAANLTRVVEQTAGNRNDWVPVLPFCRGVLLAMYIELAAGSFGAKSGA